MGQKNIVRGQRVTRRKAQQAKELRRNMTAAETLMWQRLRRNQLGGYHFRRQQIIEGFIVDFYCHQVGLIVELDGEIHQNQKDQDKQRENSLTEHGFQVIRFSNEFVFNALDSVLSSILQTCHTLATSQRPPFPSGEGPGERS